ncbi:transcriptional regulator, LacI family [Kribbella flavida DSM 17836]|uniref:Transcriptional regulator, LacI family n=1 Tax=Kribbella flavida (strain DSM 17836 / JCM 10339 / NBRC 14399) TaxID=479435 RepID=D2PS56_KRIFD|nr:LacI family DNA-binding transcriptional regulator [Kribbella flavida]ADB31180.1 transcriptional regulator, LacI family [Kribbella flavida DSM 17836]
MVEQGRSTATITRVAEAAGVSRATVSRVMNGHSTVAPELAERVLAAARALDYAPSPVARSLALGRTATIALIVPDLSNPMFQDVLRGLSLAAGADGHRLLIAESNEHVEDEEVLAIEARRRCDGVVLASPRLPTADLERLVPQLTPLVLINRKLPGSGVPSLSVDHAAGIGDLVAHLLSLGHRRIAYLAGPPASTSNRDRLDALLRLSDHGREFELIQVPCGAMFDNGHDVAGEVAGSGATAVVAYNDMVAFGALSGLHELGVSVPGQISITGFDDIPFARFTTPPLTTAAVPKNTLGKQAWEQLRNQLDGRRTKHEADFRPRLLVRGSTGRVSS